MTGAHIFLYGATELNTIHDRHHDVTDNNIGNIFLCQFPSFLTIDGGYDLIISVKGRSDVFTDIIVILYCEYDRAGICFFFAILRVYIIFCHIEWLFSLFFV